MTYIKADTITDSISEDGVRLTTLSLTYPRFIHSELMTHRVFSRNSASSRAIPIAKMIDRVREHEAIPIHWGKNKRGMQADAEIPVDSQAYATFIWKRAADAACNFAAELSRVGVHKQVANRILEPFTYTKTLVTATEWENFYDLRRHKDAQPEIKCLADCMYEAMQSSKPALVLHEHWHLPYSSFSGSDGISRSVARCARVSYTNHEDKSTTAEEDNRLTDRLRESKHWSPFEHQAMPIAGHLWSNNFRGWRQLREIMQNADNSYKIR